MSATPFDTDLFMNTTVSEANATKVIPCPAGEYNAQVDGVKTKTTDEGKVVMDVLWNIDSADAKAKTGKDKVVVRQSVWLDFDNGTLAFGEGKNVALGRLRAALNQNNAGQPWSPSMLVGGTAKVKVINEPDKKTGDVYDRVVAAAKLG